MVWLAVFTGGPGSPCGNLRISIQRPERQHALHWLRECIRTGECVLVKGRKKAALKKREKEEKPS